ncbi:MAG: class I SAM-dependent methyltransferase [Candidatus Wallbacteria bacterium]|nr:class I SAM-dependent methyltransferase [Candidatus Wallbacteria bacterium]
MNIHMLFDFEAVFDPDDYLYFYGDTLTDERTDREVEFLVRELGITRKNHILELACGHGRHSNALAGLGYQVTGFDSMKGFLELAKKDARKKGLKVKYLHGDMRDMEFDSCFDRVNLLFTAFGYFVDEENLQVLKNVNRALKTGGLFCFDIYNRDMLLKRLQNCMITEKEGNLMIDRVRFDSITGRTYNKRIVIRNGKIKHKPFFVRQYCYTEMRDLLTQAGFTIREVFGSFDGEKFESESIKMIVVAEKNKA